MQITQSVCCYCCGGEDLAKQFTYSAPPEGETHFPFSSEIDYRREVLCCNRCGHFMSVHQLDDSQLYSQEYVDTKYGNGTLLSSFKRIVSLKPTRSDNVGRCERIVQFAQKYLDGPIVENRRPTILDVGSGLCVFLHGMKSAGWIGTALDPDPRAVEQASQVVGVNAVCGDFFEVDGLGQFDVVTFNKVLEHVADPVSMLAHSKQFLHKRGFVYVELPDGEVAASQGPGRQEFFIEHHHIFSLTSLAMMATRAGFVVRTIERLQEPSNKFTLRAFLTVR